jgi:hypothetical protein
MPDDPFVRLIEQGRGLSSDAFVRMLKGSGGPTRKELISVQDLAVGVGVSIRTLRRWNKLPGAPKRYRKGRRLMYRRADVQAWLERSKGKSVDDVRDGVGA